MKIQDWASLYLVAGESFTRWVALLFYGFFGAVAFVAIGLVSVLALVMIWRVS
jgi:hypothetical protein